MGQLIVQLVEQARSQPSSPRQQQQQQQQQQTNLTSFDGKNNNNNNNKGLGQATARGPGLSSSGDSPSRRKIDVPPLLRDEWVAYKTLFRAAQNRLEHVARRVEKTKEGGLHTGTPFPKELTMEYFKAESKRLVSFVIHTPNTHKSAHIHTSSRLTSYSFPSLPPSPLPRSLTLNPPSLPSPPSTFLY